MWYVHSNMIEYEASLYYDIQSMASPFRGGSI